MVRKGTPRIHQINSERTHYIILLGILQYVLRSTGDDAPSFVEAHPHPFLIDF